jgi:hypothetical protein
MEGGSVEAPMSIGQGDLGDLDADACELVTVEYLDLLDETPEAYGISGEMTTIIVFDGDEAAGTATLAGEVIEGDEVIGNCDQEFEIQGSRL